jgi:hypothetical protein
MTHKRLLRLSGALPLILVLAACTSGASATPSPTTAAVPSAAAPSTGTAASPSSEASPGESESAETYEVKVAQATIGGASVSFLTGEDGKTLYVFKKDVATWQECLAARGIRSTREPAEGRQRRLRQARRHHPR